MRNPTNKTLHHAPLLVMIALSITACEHEYQAGGDGTHEMDTAEETTDDGDTSADTDENPDDDSYTGDYADVLPGDAWSGDPSEWTMSHDGLDFSVRSAGEGENVLVVINGGPGQSHHYCESAEVLATSQVRVVTYDQRGTGATPHPTDDDYSLDAYVADLEGLRVELGVDQLHLLGHSFGGLFAIAYVSAHPDRVASLQLFASSPATYMDTDTTEFEARIAEYEADGTFPDGYDEIENSNDCAPYFQTIWPVYLYDDAFAMTDGLLETTCDLETFFGTSSSNMFGWDYTNATARYEGPVGVYTGEADPFLSESLSSTQHFGAAQVQETVFSECGHYWEECADTFFAVAASFLADAI